MISVFGSDFGDLEKTNVIECLESQWIGFGGKVTEFESAFSKSLGYPEMVMVDSGSNALYLALKLLDLPPKSEVLLPALTWISCANAVYLNNLTPVFVDVEIDSMNVSLRTISDSVSPKTSAIMVVHFAGLPVDVPSLTNLNLPIIEDCAHAVYSKYSGMPVGSMGDISIFSFDAVKNLAVGEGGGITAKDQSLINRARELRYCGIRKSGFEAATSLKSDEKLWWQYDLTEPFIKMLPTNIAGAIGLAQLERRHILQNRRELIWNYYSKELQGIGDLILPIESNKNDVHSFFTYVIRTNQRDELAQFLLKNGVYTTLRYEPLNLYEVFKQSTRRLSNTELIARTALSIPLHPRITESDMDKIVKLIKQFFQN